MKLRKSMLSIWLVLVMVVSVFGTKPDRAFAAEKSYEKGDKMNGMILQFYMQDGADDGYSWHTYAQDTPTYGEKKTIEWKASGADKFAKAANQNVKLGFQIGDAQMEEGETAAVHFVISNIVFQFNSYEEIRITEPLDYEVLWTCNQKEWGKDGNSTAIDMLSYFTQAEPAVMAKDLVSVSCDFVLDYYEYGATKAREKAKRIVGGIARNMGAGVNVTGALDALNCTGDEITTQMIQTYKELGYKTIRVPVCFDNHSDSSGNVEGAFLLKIKSLMEEITSNGMYAILAVEATGGWAEASENNADNGKNRLTNLWATLAKEFKNSDQKLVFELISKPTVSGAPNETNYTILSEWYAEAVAVIRATGEKNKERGILLCPFNNTASYLANMTWPSDNNIMVSGMLNAPISFASAVTGSNVETEWKPEEKLGDVRSILNTIKKAVGELEIPVVITSFGAVDKGNYAARASYAYDVTKLAQDQEYGYPCLWTDNGTIKKNEAQSYGLLNREDCSVVFPAIARAAVAAAAKESMPEIGEDPVYPEGADDATASEDKNNNSNNQTPQKDKKLITIVVIVVAGILVCAVIALIIIFKRKNGSFF